MRSIILIIKSNFTSRKSMTLLTGLAITLSTLLFSSGIAILNSIAEPFDKTFNALNASHILLLYDVNNHNTADLKNWFARQPETQRINVGTPYFLSSGPLMCKGLKMEVMVQLTEHNDDNAIQDKLIVIGGTSRNAPGHGEIWIPQYLAVNNHINIGDTIGIPGPTGIYKVVVSATIVDPHYGSGMVNPTRAWLAPDELAFFVPVTQLRYSMLGVRLKDARSTAVVWERFRKGHDYSGVNLTYSLFRSAYMAIYQVMANVILIFSILALIIALLMVGTSITRAIYDDYRLIGIYSSLGMTPGSLVFLYVIQYVILGLLSVSAGLVATWIIMKWLLHSVSQKLGAVESSAMPGSAYSVSFAIVIFVVAIIALIKSSGAAKIKPVQAIRHASPPPVFAVSPLQLNMAKSIASLPMIFGLKMLTSQPGKSITQLLVATATIFIIIFSINIVYSFENLKNNKPMWGFEEGDILLRRKEAIVIGLTHEQLMAILANDKNIQNVSPYNYASVYLLNKENVPTQEIFGKVYSNILAEAGLVNLSGSHPQGKNEISLCSGTAGQLNKNPGDSVNLLIDGQRVTFLVKGVYQDVSNMGQGFRLHTNAYSDINPLFEPSIYSIKLKKNIDVKQFEKNLLKRLGETITIDPNIEERIAQMGIIDGIKTALITLSIFFIAIMLLSIGSDIVVSIKESRKTFAVFTSVGWTPKQVRMSMVYKVTLTIVIALTVSVPLAIWSSPFVLSQLTAEMGLIRFPFLVNYIGTTIVLPLTVIWFGACAWWLSRPAGYTMPRILMTS